MSGYFSGSFHNLFHSKADSVSKVKDIALSAVSQIVHSQNMCLSEVIDMDIIPYAGAIFCIIIRTENGNILSLDGSVPEESAGSDVSRYEPHQFFHSDARHRH